MTQQSHEVPMFWQEFRHRCGCYLQWGKPVPDTTLATHSRAQKDMFKFFQCIAPFPCPMHGSATGTPAPPLTTGAHRYMPANDVWYRACPDDRRIYGDRTADYFCVPED